MNHAEILQFLTTIRRLENASKFSLTPPFHGLPSVDYSPSLHRGPVYFQTMKFLFIRTYAAPAAQTPRPFQTENEDTWKQMER